MRFVILFLASLAYSFPAFAEESPICPDRGAIQTCTLDKDHLQIEESLFDWQKGQTKVLDTVMRYGISDKSEIQIGYSPIIWENGQKHSSNIVLTYRKRLNSGKLSLAVQPSIEIPTYSKARGQIGVAVSYELPSMQLYYWQSLASDGMTKEALGTNIPIRGTLGSTVEVSHQYFKSQHQAALNLTMTWDADDDLEFDINANLGLTPYTPCLQLVTGVTKRF